MRRRACRSRERRLGWPGRAGWRAGAAAQTIVAVLAAAVAGGGVGWFFFRPRAAADAAERDGVQEFRLVIKGGYSPASCGPGPASPCGSCSTGRKQATPTPGGRQRIDGYPCLRCERGSQSPPRVREWFWLRATLLRGRPDGSAGSSPVLPAGAGRDVVVGVRDAVVVRVLRGAAEQPIDHIIANSIPMHSSGHSRNSAPTASRPTMRYE